MENSILLSTKKILGIAPDYTVFDLDIITHINSSLSIVNQLGIGPSGSMAIEDESAEWDDLDIPQNQLSLVRTYIFLRVRMLFDPPGTSFLIDAMTKQIQEHEYRLSYFREATVPMSEEVRSDYENIDPIY
jgi:hypothetical protein